MSLDPSEALQVVFIARLKTDPAVAALVGARVYDQLPPDPTFPYITGFEIQTIEAGADCHDGTEAFIDLHVWSRDVGSVEAKRIVSAVRMALHEADLNLGPNHRLIDLAFRDSRTLRDPDGLSTHSIVTFRALTEPK